MRTASKGRRSVCALAGWVALAAGAQTAAPPAITISPVLPSDIPGGAPNATLAQAAAFAWQEFIALNWPAAKQTGEQGTRERADTTRFFGDASYNNATNPLVWHTYRGKVEIFPGFGLPPGSESSSSNSTNVIPLVNQNASAPGRPAYYGYDAAPAYVYSVTPIPPSSGKASVTTPWINLDENSQIGLDLIYAGAGTANAGPSGSQILFTAKGSRVGFDYLAPLGWWAGGAPFASTKDYVQKNLKSPPPASPTFVSFPNGTVELKAAWRKLAPNENAKRFYTTTVRYYLNTGGVTQYVDDTFALLSLHIIQKTTTAPYFIFATFEQADNITDASGKPVEDDNGKSIGALAVPALTPDIVSQNATAQSYQTFQPTQSSVQNPLGQLFFQNEPGQGLATGTILVNRRKHPIPSEVVAVNAAAHAAISAYVQKQFGPGATSPWAHYKLINVQYKPLDGKTPGVDYKGPDVASFYQANSVVETDYNLQVFSGRFYPGNGPFASSVGNTITDFNLNGTPFSNVAHAGKGYNMGGCMGCHGNAQQGGADFSFILLGGPVTSGPDTVTPPSGVASTGSLPPPASGRTMQRYKLRLP